MVAAAALAAAALVAVALAQSVVAGSVVARPPKCCCWVLAAVAAAVVASFEVDGMVGRRRLGCVVAISAKGLTDCPGPAQAAFSRE